MNCLRASHSGVRPWGGPAGLKCLRASHSGVRPWGGPAGSRAIEPGRRPVLELHPQRQPAGREHFLDLVQRLAAEVRRLQKLGLGALDEIADVVDVLRLETVRRAYGELQIDDRPQKERID